MVSDMPAQSPVDIVDARDKTHVETLDATQTALTLGTAPAEMELVNGGANFHVNWNDREQNCLTLDGKKYYTVQFHFHSPSEHTVNGKARAMELHLVHQADDGALAVVGVFFCEGRENAFLAQFWDRLGSLAPGKRDRMDVGKLSGSALGELFDGELFRYSGSLTTPPYSEGVEWVVVRDLLEASAAQLEAYRAFLSGPNARDVQPLNGRSVARCKCSSTLTPIGP